MLLSDVIVAVQIRAPPGQWILGNVGRYGFFRMNYDDNMWQQLANQLLSDHLVSGYHGNYC